MVRLYCKLFLQEISSLSQIHVYLVLVTSFNSFLFNQGITRKGSEASLPYTYIMHFIYYHSFGFKNDIILVQGVRTPPPFG